MYSFWPDSKQFVHQYITFNLNMYSFWPDSKQFVHQYITFNLNMYSFWPDSKHIIGIYTYSNEDEAMCANNTPTNMKI